MSRWITVHNSCIACLWAKVWPWCLWYCQTMQSFDLAVLKIPKPTPFLRVSQTHSCAQVFEAATAANAMAFIKRAPAGMRTLVSHPSTQVHDRHLRGNSISLVRRNIASS